MRKTTYLFSLFFFFSVFAFSQKGMKIEVDIDGFKKDTMILGYYMGSNQYVLDTAARTSRGFVFKTDTLQPQGMYMVILPPLNEAIQFILAEDQQFKISAKYDEGVKDVTFKGSDENDLYYRYVNFIQAKRPESNRLRKQLDSMDVNDPEFERIDKAVVAIDNEVAALSKDIRESHPNSFTAMILDVNEEIDIPEFQGEEQDVAMKRFLYFRDKYYQKMHLKDPRMFRTPYLYERVNYFVDKLTMRSPDSLIVTVDRILGDLDRKETSEGFRYYLVHLLNKYAKSKIIGQDAVYVHIVDNYYAKDKAPWTDAEQLSKIMKNARSLRPILVGKTAPNLTLQDKEGNDVAIHDIEAEYTVLYFWNPDCGHCKKSTPKLIEFQKANADKGIRVVTICGKMGKDYPKCWEYIDESKDMDVLLNLGDVTHKSRYKMVYYVKNTPKLFLLDKDKKILSKGFGTEQLPELMKILAKEDK